MSAYQDVATRLFRPDNARLLVSEAEASILIDDDTGTIFFRHGRIGIAFNPKVGAWSTPLEWEEKPVQVNNIVSVLPECSVTMRPEEGAWKASDGHRTLEEALWRESANS